MEPLNVNSNTWLWATAACLALSLALVVKSALTVEPLPLPRGGTRGQNRQRALGSPLFRACDPFLRRAGAVVQGTFKTLGRALPAARPHLKRWDHAAKKQLVWAGEPLGLERHEAWAISALSSALATGLSLAWFPQKPLVVATATAVGALALPMKLRGLRTDRFAEVSRELPAAIDLIALSMNAGSDFPGAIRRVIRGQSGVVAEEMAGLLRSLDLGITRSAALLALKERVPVPEVRDLVRAVLLAERKGASIREALSQQAKTSRQRRSVRAEEAAARAGVLLLVPLMLLMGCIMILLVGPLLTSGVSL